MKQWGLRDFMNLPEGFFFSGIKSGIKKNKKDLGLLWSSVPLTGYFAFTSNAVKAAPILMNLRKIKVNNSLVQAVLVNSGNANCFTGQQGLRGAETTTKILAEKLRISADSVLSCSTGIIGKPFPVQKIVRHIPKLIQSGDASQTALFDFAKSIMTTDTYPKIVQERFSIGTKEVHICGIAKGVGMIHPNMATMLAFLLTDANISRALLKNAACCALATSFNSITVDGCMSTNDSAFFLTSKKVPLSRIEQGTKSYRLFSHALSRVCLKLAQMLVRDGEGATKFITITVCGAANNGEARRAALAIANSNLFKCALYGSNRNLGRIVQAIGQAGVPINERIAIRATDLHKKEIRIRVDLNRGRHSATVYTCDLTPEYVKINADYS